MLNKIKRLIQYLPEKDIGYAKEFIEKRNFISLFELVDSSIKRIEISKTRGSDKYSGINVNNLMNLKVLVKEYLQQLSYDADDFDNDVFNI